VALAKALRLKIGEALAVTIGVKRVARNVSIEVVIAGAASAGRVSRGKLQSFMKTIR
jgi:hypothetical protein